MKRKRTVWILGAIVSALLLISLILTLVAPARSIVFDVSGKEGESVTAQITVDGVVEEHTRLLPASFALDANHVDFAVIPSRRSAQPPITVAMSVDGTTIATCTDTAVNGHFSCRGVLGLGSRNLWIGGMTATEPAGK